MQIDETRHPEEAKKYDYYYVPTFFKGDEKVYEAAPGDTSEKMREILGQVLAGMK